MQKWDPLLISIVTRLVVSAELELKQHDVMCTETYETLRGLICIPTHRHNMSVREKGGETISKVSEKLKWKRRRF